LFFNANDVAFINCIINYLKYFILSTKNMSGYGELFQTAFGKTWDNVELTLAELADPEAR